MNDNLRDAIAALLADGDAVEHYTTTADAILALLPEHRDELMHLLDDTA